MTKVKNQFVFLLLLVVFFEACRPSEKQHNEKSLSESSQKDTLEKNKSKASEENETEKLRLSNFLPPKQKYNSSEFGEVIIELTAKNDYTLLVAINDLNDNELAIRTLPFDLPEHDSDLLDIFYLDFSLVDRNKDKKDDVLIVVSGSQSIGAGPQAGMVFPLFEVQYEYIYKNGKWEPEGVKNLAGEDYIIGLDIPDEDKEKYLMQPNENLIFSFKTKSAKTLSVAIDVSQDYLIYRFGKPNAIEFEYRQDKGSSEKEFMYLNEENHGGYIRYPVTELSFINDDYKYCIYNAYSEHNDDYSGPKGVGIIVTNMKTQKCTIIEGDNEYGDFEDLEEVEWIKKAFQDREWDGKRLCKCTE